MRGVRPIGKKSKCTFSALWQSILLLLFLFFAGVIMGSAVHKSFHYVFHFQMQQKCGTSLKLPKNVEMCRVKSLFRYVNGLHFPAFELNDNETDLLNTSPKYSFTMVALY